MSKFEMIRCDGCGIVRGEDGRGSAQWAEVTPPSDPDFPQTFGALLASKKNFCLNCWGVIEQHIPSLPQRPMAPVKRRK